MRGDDTLKARIVMGILVCTTILLACGNIESASLAVPPVELQQTEKPTQAENEKANFEQQIAFEREYSPIMTEGLAWYGYIPFDPYGHYYLDSSDKMNLKFVFLVDQIDSGEMKQLADLLIPKMGTHIEFRQAKRPQYEIEAIRVSIVKQLETMQLRGGWSVGFNVWKEKLILQAYLTDEEKTELVQQYGSDVLEVEIYPIITEVGYVVDQKEGAILVTDPNVVSYGATGGEPTVQVGIRMFPQPSKSVRRWK
jgi:hypothetical protein